MRSVLENFRDSTKKFIIFTSDFDFPIIYSPVKYLLGISKRSTPSASTLARSTIEERSRRGKKQGSRKAKSSASRKAKEIDPQSKDFEDLYEDDDAEEDEFEYARLGLLPQWLKLSLGKEDIKGHDTNEHFQYDAEQRTAGVGIWKDGDVSLEVVHHAEVYGEYDGTVFNSNSIESQLGRIAGDHPL